MKTEIKHKNMSLKYEIIALNKIDVELFLNSDNPHEIILAVLCKYERKDAPQIIEQILKKLNSKAQNKGELHEYVTDLEYYRDCVNCNLKQKNKFQRCQFYMI